MGGCGVLEGLDVTAHQAVEHRRNPVGVPVLSAVLPRPVLGPDAQHDLERFAGHLAVLTVLAVHIEERPVARDTAGADAEHEAALGEVVEVRDAVGQFDRVVIGQQVCTGCELDRLRAQQRLRQQQVGRADRLPRHGEVLADPRLDIAQLVGQLDDVEVPLGGVVQAALRRMRRHEENSDLHLNPSQSWPRSIASVGTRPPRALRDIADCDVQHSTSKIHH